MKIFIDSANIAEIEQAAYLGICDGVTTNPSLLAKNASSNIKEIFKTICQMIPGPVSAEVVATDHKTMLNEAEMLVGLHENIVIKLPLTQEGLKACKVLTNKGVKTNVTLCFQSGQALLAAKCGATYISPFIGRLDDVSEDGGQLIRDIRMIFDNFSYKTQILAASIRHPRHVIESALAGADVATCPLKIIQSLYQHPLTEKGLNQFLEDWKKSGLNL